MSNKNIINTHRHLVLLVDFKNCNPQGDPDQDNAPRTDPETTLGLITASGLKRKVRDFFANTDHEVYVSRGACLQRLNKALATEAGIGAVFDGGEEEDEGEESEDEKPKRGQAKPKTAKKASQEDANKVYDALAAKYIDARLFGQLIPKLPGFMRGPIQVSMGESVDPIQVLRMAITRVAVATEKEEKAQGGANRGMGGLYYIPYGLYRFHIYVNPSDAKRTGCTEEDYERFLSAVKSMFDNDRSSVRSSACVRAFYEFRQKEVMHGTVLGERLLESIRVVRNPNKNQELPPRSFDDYSVLIPDQVRTSVDYEFRKIVSEESAFTYNGTASAAAE